MAWKYIQIYKNECIDVIFSCCMKRVKIIVYASTWGANNKKKKQSTWNETLPEEKKGHSDIRKREKHLS